MRHPTPCTTHPLHRRIWQLYPKQAPQLLRGLPKLRVRRRNPPVGSEPPKATRVRDKVTQSVASSWRIRSPIEGTRHPEASYLSPSWGVFITPLCVGWHSHPGFPTRDYPGKIHGTTWSGFDRRGTCPGRLSHANGDLGSTQILTQHCGTQNQTAS
jgi:hypothetical protein